MKTILIFCGVVLIHLVTYTSTSESDRLLYSYPVAEYKVAGTTHILILNQYLHQKRELYDMNIDSRNTIKMLMSWYNPAGVVLLPNFSGFSFIDNGRIRIKHFEKRSVRSLEIYEPIYGIELVHWLDDETCYFHAIVQGHYALFTLTSDEILTCVASNPFSDYMYPAIVGSNLFFIEGIEKEESIHFKLCVLPLKAKDPEKIDLLLLGTAPHIMLHMFSEDKGSIIACRDSSEEQYFFEYIELTFDAQRWHKNSLFSFSVSKKLLGNESTKVYESILPFIPRDIGSYIVFSSYNQKHDHMALYYYDKHTGMTNMLKSDGQEDLFVPIIVNKTCFYGGAVSAIGSIEIDFFD